MKCSNNFCSQRNVFFSQRRRMIIIIIFIILSICAFIFLYPHSLPLSISFCLLCFNLFSFTASPLLSRFLYLSLSFPHCFPHFPPLFLSTFLHQESRDGVEEEAGRGGEEEERGGGEEDSGGCCSSCCLTQNNWCSSDFRTLKS